MTETPFKATRDFAVAMDAADPLASYRERFYFPKTKSGETCVYLCGHSLGLQPKEAKRYVVQELDDWAQLGVEAHFRARSPWLHYHRLLTDQTAELVGAKPIEVVVMNSLTVDLHLMMVSFYRPTRQRHKILIERGAFPSDQYAIKSHIHFRGFDPASSLLEVAPRKGESCIPDEDILSLIEKEGDSIALILFAGVNYATGQAFDLAGITQAGHVRGCIVGFDLAHAAGNLALQLHDVGPDFAVWCSYKYLNGGPGCVAGCFVHERHAHEFDTPRFAGWWGNREETRFEMRPEFCAIIGAEGWQLSNPPILPLAALRSSMAIFHEVGMERLRAKSVSLTGYLEFLLNQHTSSQFSVITPHENHRRGAQLSIRVPDCRATACARLASESVFVDWRETDILRVAPAPLYNSYQDVYSFTEHFLRALK